jgi:hypothetical protein
VEDTRVGTLAVVIVHTVVAEVARKAVGVLHRPAITVDRIQVVVVRYRAVRVKRSLVVAVEEHMSIVEVDRRVVIAAVGVVRVDRRLSAVQALRTFAAEAVLRQRSLEGSVVGTVAAGGIAAKKVAAQTFKSSLVQAAFGSRDSFGATRRVVGNIRVGEASLVQREPSRAAGTKQEMLRKVAASFVAWGP